LTITQISGTVFADNAPGYDVVRLPHPLAGLAEAGAPVWRDAVAIEWGPEPYRTRFQACWDPLALHVRFDAVDDSPWHTMATRDDHIWEEEVVEIFLDLDGSGVNYAELEISPANVVCDLRVERPAPSVKSLTEWDWLGMASTVVPLRDAHGGAEGWTALARLPWEGLGTLSSQAASRVPPKAGDRWHFNVFRIKRPGGPKARNAGAVYAAWSVPDGQSFHVPAKFRPFKFA
jgi:Carbohydrate family 9 binding domain-like